jgi:predicted TIM-barrel fold metal-dependent hydrolase
MTVDIESDPRTRNASPTPLTLVDTDVHEGLRSIEQLEPYLDDLGRYWIRQNNGAHTRVEGEPFVSPVGNTAHARGEWVLEDGTAGTSLDLMAKHLFEEEAVSIAILNGFFYMSARGGSYEYCRAVLSAYNDWQIEEWLNKDSRLRGSVHVVADDPALAAAEIDRVAEHPQIVQVFLPLVTDRQYGSPMYHPIYEAAVRNNLAVAFHHGSHTRTLFGWPRYYIEWHMMAAPQSAQNQLLSLICNGVFDRYPELTAVFLESGVAWVPWFMWRLDEQYRESKAEVPWVRRLPSEHMRSNVRIATQPLGDITPKQFVQLVEMAGTEDLFMFSTDYPHYDGDSADFLANRAVSDELARKVRYQNALDSYPRLRSLSA